MQYSAPIVRITTPVGANREAVGTGFCIENDTETNDIIFLTNAHVVAPGAKHSIQLAWAPGHLVPVHVSAIIYDRDIALLSCSREVWEKTANTYLKNKELQRILKVPTLKLGHSGMYVASGTPVMCKGHPLGLPEQQVSYGNTRGVINMPNGEQRNLIQAPINHGNSGGPVLVNFQNDEYVIGISTMKLSGKDVEGEGGMININEIRAVLPSLKKTLKKTEVKVDQKVFQTLRNMFGATFPAVIAAGLEPKKINWLVENGEKHLEQWDKHAVGGRVHGQPRAFSAWLMRHVIDGDKFLYNGDKVLHYVLEQSMLNNYDELAEFKTSNGGWKAIRLNANVNPLAILKMMKQYKQDVTTLLHAPILGWTNTQSTHNVDYKDYYNIKDDKNGMIINTVFRDSLYAKGNGKAGDLVYAFQKNDEPIVHLDKEGRFSSSGALGMRLSIATMCHHIEWDIGQENPTNIKLFALEKGGVEKTVSFTMKTPSKEDLPAMHMITPFNNETQQHTGGKLLGFTFTQMHMNHVQQMKLLEYLDPVRQYEFKVLCMGYPSDGVHIAPGSTLMSMNGWDGEKEVDIDAASWKSWSDFTDAMKNVENAVKEKKLSHWKAVFGRPGFKVTVIKQVN